MYNDYTCKQPTSARCGWKFLNGTVIERVHYSKKGRHTPMMIIVKGGMLSDDSFNNLTKYMNNIKGEVGNTFLSLWRRNHQIIKRI